MMKSSQKQRKSREDSVPHCHMHSAVEKLQASNCPKYECEAERILSFVGWPLEQVIHPEQLARVGFVYTGEGSLVQCFQCGVSYRNWLKGDIALSVHQRCNPHCNSLSCTRKPSPLQRAHPLNLPTNSECVVNSLQQKRLDDSTSATVVNLSVPTKRKKTATFFTSNTKTSGNPVRPLYRDFVASQCGPIIFNDWAVAGMEHSLTGQCVTEEDQGAIRPPSGSQSLPPQPLPIVSKPIDSCMHIGSIYDRLKKHVTDVSKLQHGYTDSLKVSTCLDCCACKCMYLFSSQQAYKQ